MFRGISVTILIVKHYLVLCKSSHMKSRKVARHPSPQTSPMSCHDILYATIYEGYKTKIFSYSVSTVTNVLQFLITDQLSFNVAGLRSGLLVGEFF